MSSSFLRILLSLLLLVAGFFGGIAWKNRHNQPIASLDQPAESPGSNETRSGAVPPDQGLSDSELATIRLFENAAPSVCYITTTNVGYDFFTRNATEIPAGTGSGFVWDRNGHIITNYHVIQNADKATVNICL